ncbi:MAG: hypothetical protein ACREX4_24450 [Gammaproteobacteria bacterium]
MNPKEKAVLTTTFEALGPERVTRGLKATGHKWKDCFLAIATYGEPDALAREMEKARRKQHFVGALIGVPVQVVEEFVRLWDHDEQSFRALAAEWLELGGGAVLTAPAATA